MVILRGGPAHGKCVEKSLFHGGINRYIVAVRPPLLRNLATIQEGPVRPLPPPTHHYYRPDGSYDDSYNQVSDPSAKDKLPTILGDYTTRDGVKIKVGDWLYKSEQPPAVVAALCRDGMVCVEGRGVWAGQRAQWWPSHCYSTEDAILKAMRENRERNS